MRHHRGFWQRHSDDRREVLRTIVEYDYDDPTHAAARLGTGETANVVAAALTVAGRRKFGDKPDPQAVADYVDGLRGSSEGAGKALTQQVGESLIRGMLGEPELLDKVDSDTFIPAGILISYSLVAEEELDSDGEQEFIHEAMALVAQWENEPLRD